MSATGKKCYLCGSNDTLRFFDLPPVPTMDGCMSNSIVEAQSVNKGAISLQFCNDCNYLSNSIYDPNLVSYEEYDFANDYSPSFQSFTRDLCGELVSRLNLQGKSVMDVGCGQGLFLKTLCEATQGLGFGIDPAFSNKEKNSEKLTYFQDYFDHKYKDLNVDLITSILVLTNIDDPVGYLNNMRSIIGDRKDTYVFFEVPNAKYTFENNVIWNVVYEHKSWYTKSSLHALLNITGFDVVDIFSLWNDEFLGVIGRPSEKPLETYRDQLKDETSFLNTLKDFDSNFKEIVESTKEKITEIKDRNLKTLAWCAGARAISFFNVFDLEDVVDGIVDLNTLRQGKYLPGSGHKIISPQHIKEVNPDLIIITNPTYELEIKNQVKTLGVNSEYWVI